MTKSTESTVSNHKVVSREEWIQYRIKLLAKEKAFLRTG